jgi:hypothetical protein
LTGLYFQSVTSRDNLSTITCDSRDTMYVSHLTPLLGKWKTGNSNFNQHAGSDLSNFKFNEWQIYYHQSFLNRGTGQYHFSFGDIIEEFTQSNSKMLWNENYVYSGNLNCATS